MLVTLEDKPYANMTIPGKVQSYMAAGKAVVGVANGSCASFILNNGIGYSCRSNDYRSLAELLKKLDMKTLKNIGAHSKEVYFKKYSKSIFITKLIQCLSSFVN